MMTSYKTKKRSFLLFLVLIMTFCSFSPMVFAATENRVYDFASLFSTQENEILETSIADIKAACPIDIAIVTITDNEGKSAESFARDFYIQNGLGNNRTIDGIILLIDMESRQISIIADDDRDTYFTDERIDAMLDTIPSYLSNSQYYEGAIQFLQDVSDYIDAGIVVKQARKPFTDKYGHPLSAINIFTSSLISILVALVISLIVRLIIIRRYTHPRTTVPETTPDRSSVHYTGRDDHFVSTHTSRVRIQSNSSSGGGGGGGRSFHGGSRGF